MTGLNYIHFQQKRIYLFTGFLLFWLTFTLVPEAFSAVSHDPSIQWFGLLMNLFGGLALFLAGLELLSEGLKKAAGGTLKSLLSKMTSHRLLGAATGAFITAVLNSSSVTTVLVVSFITAGVMTLAQSVGVIMGANIGSTMTAQLLAFNLTAYALFPVAVGFFMTFAGKTERIKYPGMMLMGLGLVFFGMGIMSGAMSPLRTYEPFMLMLKNMERPLLGILAGAVFTALVQSSAATVGIAIAMATEGLLSLPAGIALALGANIGTCATALLAALGKPAEAVRAAIIHILFNIAGVVIWLPFIGTLAHIAVAVSPGDAAAAIPRQIANANTLFNVINTIVFIGFTQWFAKAAEALYPGRPETRVEKIKPKYLDEQVLSVPAVALEQVRMEYGRMGEIARAMLVEFLEATRDWDDVHVGRIGDLGNQVKGLGKEIFKYLGKIRQEALTAEDSRIHQTLMAATVNLETLADVIETDLTGLVDELIRENLKMSLPTREMLLRLYDEVLQSLEFAVQSIRDNDLEAAEKTISKKEVIGDVLESLMARQSERIGLPDSGRLKKHKFVMSIMDKFLRIYTLNRHIAEILPEEKFSAP